MANSNKRSAQNMHIGQSLWRGECEHHGRSVTALNTECDCFRIDTNTHVCADLIERLKIIQRSGTGKVVVAGARLLDSSDSAVMFGLPGKNPEFRWKDDASNAVYTIEFVSGISIYKSIPGWSSRDWMDMGVRRILDAIV